MYNRGNDRQRVFVDDSDYCLFLDKMKSLALDYSIVLPIYALMPNHYHMIMAQQTAGNISDMMGSLATSVTKRYNLKYEHIGHLFQGPFRYKPVSEESLWIVGCYIHMNPVRAKFVARPENWKYSNFMDMKVTYSLAQAPSHVAFDPFWSGYPDYVEEVFNDEMEEARFWERLRPHTKGFIEEDFDPA